VAVDTTPPPSGTPAGAGSGHGVFAPGRAGIREKTLRTDPWWASTAMYTGIIVFFAIYALVRIFMNNYYFVDQFHYLTPVYSPCISESCPEDARDFGAWVGEFPTGVPLAILVFPILAGFRTTCYYYRKVGWRGLWLAPGGCAVPEPHKKYTGEARFPLNLMNTHRYFFWLASILLLINFYDVIKALTADGFRIGLGTVIMAVNVVLLALYSLSCHACRHALGGRLKHFSKHPVRYRLWTWISKLNPKHGTYAMASLFSVIVTDAYIMILSIAADGGANTLPGWL
jgi:hypothetical protein